MDNIESREQFSGPGVHSGQRLSGVKVSREQMEAYLHKLKASGCVPNTLQCYRRNLERLYRFLDEDKCIYMGTLASWQKQLLGEGYSARTINVCISAANGLMAYLGHRELQVERVTEKSEIQPELTRAEYLRLLSAARALDKERAYLMVKVFGTTGITVSDLEKVTAEAVQTGKITLPSDSVRIPDGLRGELQSFMLREGITSGPVFLTKAGKPQDRSSVTNLIGSQCTDARVPEEKGNPRCLRKLYLTTSGRDSGKRLPAGGTDV